MPITYRTQSDPYFGISTSKFSQQVLDVLLKEVNGQDVEIKPDGMNGATCTFKLLKLCLLFRNDLPA